MGFLATLREAYSCEDFLLDNVPYIIYQITFNHCTAKSTLTLYILPGGLRERVYIRGKGKL